MTDIITYSDRRASGTYAQLKLDDGSRILISLTQTEIAILKLILGGTIPTGKLFKHNISEFLDFFSVRVEQIGFGGSLLDAVVEYLLPCSNVREVVDKMSAVVDGHHDSLVQEEVRSKLEKQIKELFS